MEKTILCGLLAVCLASCTGEQIGQDHLTSVGSTSSGSLGSFTIIPESASIITPIANGWSQYKNEGYGFEVIYSSNATVEDIGLGDGERQIRISLPGNPAKEMRKYFSVEVAPFKVNACNMSSSNGLENINGISFQTGEWDGGMGWERITKWYCTVQDGRVFKIYLEIERPDSDNSDLAKEWSVLNQMLINLKLITKFGGSGNTIQ